MRYKNTIKIGMLGNRIATADTRSAAPPPKRADPELQTAEHEAWAALVKQRAGYRCEAIDDGQRCKVAAPHRLFADHIIERQDGGAKLDPANGQCLCGHHHSLKTAQARAKRMSRPSNIQRGGGLNPSSR